jgi:hypothetical protein
MPTGKTTRTYDDNNDDVVVGCCLNWFNWVMNSF